MISLVAIIGKNRAIGNNGKLLWRIPDDMARFKKLTTGHTVIMGRKTLESIGHALPNRTNIVLTRNKDYKAEKCIISNTIDDALSKAAATEAFILGGGEIYKQTIGIADRLYITLVQETPEADTFFPEYSDFTTVISEEEHDSEGISYKFLTLER